MRTATRTPTIALLAATLLLAAPIAQAQDDDHEAHHPEAVEADPAPETAPGAGSGMMGPGMMGPGMMDPEAMRRMMGEMMAQMGPEMRERMRTMMEQGDMGPGMMEGMREPSEMGPGMMRGMMGPQMMQGMMEAMLRGMAEGLARGLVEGAVRAHGMGPDAMRAHGTMRGVGIGPMMPRGMPGEVSIERVRATVEGHLVWHGNPRLRLGEVAEHEDGTITAEIETVDGSLVQRLSVDSTGHMMQVD